MRRIVFSLVALLGTHAGDALGDELTSGLQLGDLATPFEVKDVTGHNKGIELCYR